MACFKPVNLDLTLTYVAHSQALRRFAAEMGKDKDHVRSQISYLNIVITEESVANPALIIKAMKDKRPHVAAKIGTAVKSLMRFLTFEKSEWIAPDDRDAIFAKVAANCNKVKPAVKKGNAPRSEKDNAIIKRNYRRIVE